MTTNRPWTLDLNAVPERPVSRAGLLISAASSKVVVLDVDDGGFAALADMPPYGALSPLALSADGTKVLFWSIEDNGRTMLLILQTLATGLRQRITAPPGCFDYLAAVSPDGHTIATLSQDADSGFIDLVDIAAGTRRRLWSCDGGASMHGTSIAWSPNGHLIAATYYHAPTDELATAVIDADNGAVVVDHEYRVVFGCPNGTWIDNQRVVLIDDLSEELTPPAHLVDVRSGNSRRLWRPPQWEYYLAVIDGHFLARTSDGHLYLTDLDGNNPQPFLAVPADLGISTFDIAPDAINNR